MSHCQVLQYLFTSLPEPPQIKKKQQTNNKSIPHQACLEALKETLNKRKTHKVPTGKLVKMAEFVLKNNYFQFSDKVYQQISGVCSSLCMHIYGSSEKQVPTNSKVSTSCMV